MSNDLHTCTCCVAVRVRAIFFITKVTPIYPRGFCAARSALS